MYIRGEFKSRAEFFVIFQFNFHKMLHIYFTLESTLQIPQHRTFRFQTTSTIYFPVNSNPNVSVTCVSSWGLVELEYRHRRSVRLWTLSTNQAI